MAAIQRKIIIIARTNGQVDRYVLRPNVEMRFERVYGEGLSTAFNGKLSSTNLFRLAWEVDREQGGTIPGLEEWSKGIDAVNVEMEDIVPFEKAASIDDSPTSQSVPE